MKMLFELSCICALVFGILIFHVLYKKQYVAEIFWAMKLYAIGAVATIDDIVNSRYNKTDLPSQSGKVAIVTGGARGIGLEIVKKLLQCDMEVIIACRKTSAGEQAILKIRDSGITSGSPKVYKLDNSSLDSVKEFAEQIKKNYNKIYILINNAGVMFIPYTETKDGFEEQWAVNYLSHFLLTSLLLPLLKAGGHPRDCSRIINVGSCAHKLGTINFKDINYKDGFITHKAYTQSKLAQLMFTVTLQKFLVEKSLNMQTYCVHPGVVNTELLNNIYLSKFKFVINLSKTPEQGAISIIYAAVNKDITKKDYLYFSNCKEAAIHPMALDSKIQKQLFALSLKQAQINDFFQYL